MAAKAGQPDRDLEWERNLVVQYAEYRNRLLNEERLREAGLDDQSLEAEEKALEAEEKRWEEKNGAARTTLCAAELQHMSIPEPRWAIPETLTEGLVMLAAKAKIGKSWLALGWAIAIASGTPAMESVEVEEGDVLYLALEDNNRRLQARLRQLLKGRDFPSRLHFATDWPKFDAGGIAHLRTWLGEHPDTRMVIVDVWKRVRQARRREAQLYDEDYEHLRELKAVADDNRTTIVVVHHTRKASAEDVFDEVSGTGGVAAALDSILVLHRSRSEADAELWVTGRDIEEAKLALRFELGKWSLMGDVREVTRSRQRREVVEALKALGQQGDALTPANAALTLGWPTNRVRQLMFQMRQTGELNSDYSPPLMPNEDKSGNSPNAPKGEAVGALGVRAGVEEETYRKQSPCPACGSRAVVRDPDGSLRCHGCNQSRGLQP